jgi:osmotically-inducible protein OsmY
MKKDNIKKKIINQLEKDNRVDASNIKLKIIGGSITLSGSVPNYRAKNAAMLDVWKISGVHSVQNNLKVKFPNKHPLPTDSQIKSDIKTLLTSNKEIDSENIEISVSNGIVSLKGFVDAFWIKFKIKEIISNISGLTEIINEIAIVPKEEVDDKEIALEIERALSRNKKVDTDNINVKVKDAEVTLTGKVFNWDEYGSVMEIARSTSGIKKIQDNISIESL